MGATEEEMRAVGKQLLGVVFNWDDETGEFELTKSGYNFNTKYSFESMSRVFSTTAGVLKLVDGKYRIEFGEGEEVDRMYLEIKTDEQKVQAVLGWTYKPLTSHRESHGMTKPSREQDLGRWEKVSIVRAQMLVIMQKESAMIGGLRPFPEEGNFRESSRGRSLEVFAKDFARFDKDGDGFLELSEVEQLLQFQLEKPSVPDYQLQKYFAELDTDLDGKVSLAEYIRSIDGPADPNAVDNDGCTALMQHADCGNAEDVQLLLKAGADPNTADKKGITALMKAKARKVVELLLKAGADPNTADKKGCTSLYHAADRGNAEAIPLLLKAGADPNIASAPLFRAYDEEPVQYTALMVFRDGVFRWGYDDDVLALLEAAGAAALVAMSPADTAATLAAMSPADTAAALVAKQFNSNDPDDKDVMSPKRRAAALAAMSPADKAATLAAMSPPGGRAAALAAALVAMSPADRAATLATMSPADTAATLVAMSPADRAATLVAMSPADRAATLVAMKSTDSMGCADYGDRTAALAAMSPEDRAATLAAMSPEDRAAMSSAAAAATALAAMSPEDRAAALAAIEEKKAFVAAESKKMYGMPAWPKLTLEFNEKFGTSLELDEFRATYDPGYGQGHH